MAIVTLSVVHYHSLRGIALSWNNVYLGHLLLGFTSDQPGGLVIMRYATSGANDEGKNLILIIGGSRDPTKGGDHRPSFRWHSIR